MSSALIALLASQILTVQEADALDESCREFFKKTPCICVSCSAGREGIVLSIALMKYIYQPYNQHPSKTISSFAQNLRKNWKLGECDNEILIVLATVDRLAYTAVGDTTARYISPTDAHALFVNNKAYFSEGRFYAGLSAMLDDYRNETFAVEVAANPNARFWVVAFGVIAALSLSASLCLAGFVLIRNLCERRRYSRNVLGKSKDNNAKKPTETLHKSQCVKTYHPCQTEDTNVKNGKQDAKNATKDEN